MGNRLDKEREERIQPQRIAYAKSELQKKGIQIHYEDETTLKFLYQGNEIALYPYSGWHTGKGIKDGRGIANLLHQIKEP